MDQETEITCHICGQRHKTVRLASGQKARCIRCDTVLARAKRLGPDAPLAFALTGAILAIPAFLLPFISAGKFGDQRVSRLFTGVLALWDDGMRAMAMLVLLCGGLLPLGLLVAMALILAPVRFSTMVGSPQALARVAGVLERWAIPEVQVLAVLVALLKLGSLVNVRLGPGFWCYCAMALLLLLAARNFDFDALRARTESANTGSKS